MNMKCKDANELKRKIENKRRRLNQIVLEGNEIDKVLKFSQELDLLINDYYLLNNQKEVADI